MSSAKVTLSVKEQELVMDTGWILTKNAVIQKVYVLFGQLSVAYGQAIEAGTLADKQTLLAASPKISKGEYYEGLPWVMLDQPRYYRKGEAFGIRSFFWWGHGFSITLQLEGKYRDRYIKAIENYFKQVPGADGQWLTGIGEDPWQHHFREDNYAPVATQHKGLHELSFIKLTRRFSLSEWDKTEEQMIAAFAEILQMLDTDPG